MRKKSTALCASLLALAAFAAVPAAASAARLYSGSTLVPVGTEVVGKSYGAPYLATQPLAAAFYCDSSEIKGYVFENGPKLTKVQVSSVTFVGHEGEQRCSGSSPMGPTRIKLETPACLTLGNGAMRGSECAATATPLGLTIENWVYPSCHYQQDEQHFSASFQTEPLWVEATGSPFGQNNCGPGPLYLHATYKFQTASGAELKLDS